MNLRGIRIHLDNPDTSSFFYIIAPVLEENTVWDVLDQKVFLLETSGEESSLTKAHFPKTMSVCELDSMLEMPLVVVSGIFTEYQSYSDICFMLRNYADYMDSGCTAAVFIKEWKDCEIFIKDSERIKRAASMYDKAGIKYTLITDENDYRYTFRTARY